MKVVIWKALPCITAFINNKSNEKDYESQSDIGGVDYDGS